MDIDNEKIYLELLKIKKLMQQSLDLQRELTTIGEEIKIFEGRQAQDEHKIAEAIKKKKFRTILDWKRAIWDSCSAKNEHVNPSTITFFCRILNAPCRFETCPKNIFDED
ncbi:MAG: hypothetical protein KKF46_06835 [Nanoarchaeota archaeon]|nr:hypothetical protein [Nanoarchaeota archaeon]MBU1322044.1 hypothetical protein [Nanoarchaeota archaeon]MBU1597236.1 hypothetical protein [Nanoarchaeota archaeon]MBU2440719.1 hypothetical protein [Nanoarchaeota archaeon]